MPEPDLKVEILLPLRYNPDKDGRRKKVEGIKYSQTYSDIFERFGGCTIDNSPLIGGWLDPRTNKPIGDTNKTYWVICKKNKSNMLFFKKLKETLKERFAQDEIMMYYVPVFRF